MDHVQQKLWEAARALVGAGDLPTRLRAASSPVAFIAAKATPFSEPEMQERFDHVVSRLRAWYLPGAGSGVPTDQEMEAVANMLMDLFVEATLLARRPVGGL